MNYDVPPIPSHSHASYILCEPNSRPVRGEDAAAVCAFSDARARPNLSRLAEYDCAGAHSSMMASLHARVPIGLTDIHVHLVDTLGRHVSAAVNTSFSVEPPGFNHKTIFELGAVFFFFFFFFHSSC
jgi:hypothetical protein